MVHIFGTLEKVESREVIGRMTKETFAFQTEVSKLLDIVARSLYSHREIFLRELISNASDACDRLRYEAQTRSDLIAGDGNFRIVLELDDKSRTISISDNGIGMNREDLIETLGTIARSGTEAFVKSLSDDATSDVALIGQFGVGFYSSFMIADKVEVVTRKAGDEQAWKWVSDGKGDFSIEEASRAGRGTTVVLHVSDEGKEFLDKYRLETIVRTYSDHIAIPIVFADDKDGKSVNAASALWMRPRSEITEDQYREFYRHAGHAFDEPWMTIHNTVEGVLSYTNLLFVPSTRPFDLYEPERKTKVKLYVRRVFITDDCADLLPGYLRFIRGVVDSEDLSLNISREMLQHDPKLAKIRSGLIKRIIGELKKKATTAADDYAKFWEAFGAVLKEGIYEDHDNSEAILEISRFRTTTGGSEWVGLQTYLERMKEGQEAIYYITGDDVAALRSSPQIEGFASRGVEVLLLTDPVDEFWVPSLGTYKGKPFKSVARADTDLGKIKRQDNGAERPEPKNRNDLDSLVASFKLALGGAVSDVRLSQRLTESPACLVAGEGGVDIRLERLLKRHGADGSMPTAQRVLEINPDHALIKRLGSLANDGGEASATVSEAAHVLLDQARILEGEPIPDPMAFAQRLNAVLQRGLGG